MPRKKSKFLFSDESEEDDEDDDDSLSRDNFSLDNFSLKHRKRCEFRDSDAEDNECEGDEDSSQNSSLGKGKKKRGIITSDSEGSDDDNESSDNFNLKSKSRRGIIDSDSGEDGSDDDATDESGSSGDEEEENGEETENLCPICLGDFEEQMLGIPENCQHIFCMECIQEWSKNVNNCPVDRKKFNLITIKDKDGKFIKEVVVEDAKKNEEVYEDPPTYCQVCRECNREDCMLLCDECDNGYHMDCLTPPLDYVPIEEWYCTECAPPPKAASSSSSLSRRERKDSQYIGEESVIEAIVERTLDENPPEKRRHLMFGESTRTTRRQARTVASTRQSSARARARGRGGRVAAPTVTRRVSKRKKKGKRKTKGTRTSSRVKEKKAKKKLIDNELQKVREKIIHDTDNQVSLYGNPWDLDGFFNPGDDYGVCGSPLRSTIVDTPDVVGSILGGFDTLNPNNVVVSRDGRGTLKVKSEIVEHEEEPPPPTISRKRKIKFLASEDDDNNRNDKGSNHDSVKDVTVEKKFKDEDAEEAERCLQDNIKRRTLKYIGVEEKKQEGKATLIDNMRKRLKASIEKKAKEEELRKENKRMEVARQKKEKEEAVRDECNKMREASERKAKEEEEARRKKAASERKAKEEELRKECNRMRVASEKKAKEEEMKVASEKKAKEEGLQNECNRMKVASEKKAKEGVQDECSPKKPSNESCPYKSSSTLPTSTTTFKIPKLKKKPVVVEETASVSTANNNQEKSADKDSPVKEDDLVAKIIEKGDAHTKNNVENSSKKDYCHVAKNHFEKGDAHAKNNVENNSKKDYCDHQEMLKTTLKKTIAIIKNHSKKEDSHVMNDSKKDDVPSKRDSTKIDVSPSCHRQGSQKKITIDSLKKETEITKDSKKRPPLTSLEKKIKLYNMGKLKPQNEKQRHDQKYSTEKKHLTSDSSSYKRTHGNESSSSSKRTREGENKSLHKQNYNNENRSVHRKAKSQQEESKKKCISLEAYRNRRLFDDVFGESDIETTKKDSQQKPCEKTKKDSQQKPCEKTKHNELKNSNQSIKTDQASVKDPRLRVTFVDNKSCTVSNASKLETSRSHPTSTISQSHASCKTSQSEKVSKVKSPITSTSVQDVYSKYLNPSTKTYNDTSITPSKKNTENSDSPKPLDSPRIYNNYTTKPFPAKDTSQKDKINSKPSEHKHINENQGNKSSNVNKFDENSPYSVIRPFLQGSNSSSSNTPVAVISPSLRDGVSESSFKFKDTKTKTSVNTVSLQGNSICVDPRLPPTANSSLRANNTDNTKRLKNVYPDKSGVTGIATDNIEKKSMNIVNTQLKEQLKNDLQHHPLKKVEALGETDFINKIKGYLKPYYIRGLLTKDQWKVVVKTSVKTIQTHRTYFSSDDRRIEMLVQKHIQPFLIVKNVL